MSTTTLRTTIIIIGGGLTGLALGQGLKKAGISFRIYERDTAAAYRAQGYRIRIGPDGAGALRHLLPEHLWQVFQATCAAVIQGGHRLDARTGRRAEWNRGPPPAHRGNGSKWALPAEYVFNADRAVLRSLLLSGIEEHVTFGKRFERYETSTNGGIFAHFSDGTSTIGTFLVGADGVRSVVRQQLFPDFRLLDTEGRAVFGKTVITDALQERMATEIGDGITICADSEQTPTKLFCDGMRFQRPEAAESAASIDVQVPEDYIYWVFLFRNDVVTTDQDRTLLSLGNERSVRLSMDLSAEWIESIRVLFQLQTSEAASTLAFLTAPSGFESNWSSKPAELRTRVALMGDSAHPMPPVGGVGANAGFQDAADLFTALSQFDTRIEQAGQERLVSEFEHLMLQRAKGAVEQSLSGAGTFFGMKPLEQLKLAILSR